MPRFSSRWASKVAPGHGQQQDDPVVPGQRRVIAVRLGEHAIDDVSCRTQRQFFVMVEAG
jgi:hypothetical protein